MGVDRYTPAISPEQHANHAVARVGPLAELGKYEIELTAKGTKYYKDDDLN